MGEEIANALKLSRGKVGALSHFAEALGECGGIAGGEERSVIGEDFGNGTTACAERGDAACHRLDEDVAELLFPTEFHAANGFAGEDEDIEATKEIRDLRMGSGREKMEPGLLRGFIAKPGLQCARAEHGEMKTTDLFAGLHELAETFFIGEASAVADDDSIARKATGFTKGVSSGRSSRLMVFEIDADLRGDEQMRLGDAKELSSGLIARDDKIGRGSGSTINEAEDHSLPAGARDIFPGELAKECFTLMKPGEEA